MLNRTRFLPFLAAAALLLLSSCEDLSGAVMRRPETIRVACVGDSITYGAGIAGRGWNSYPSQLGGLLGKGWEVRNFGVNNATVLRRGHSPYWQTQAFEDALAFLPQIVIIKLGTNDARSRYRTSREEFDRDYLSLIERFQAIESRPKIWLCTITPIFPGRGGTAAGVVQEDIVPHIRRIAHRTGLPVIDLNSALLGKPELIPDGVHPDERGARVMAETVYAAIAGERGEGKGH